MSDPIGPESTPQFSPSPRGMSPPPFPSPVKDSTGDPPTPKGPPARRSASTPRPPKNWDAGDPGLVVGSAWRDFGLERIPGPEASRHFLITGETGAGKTASGILPLALAALAYPGPEAQKAQSCEQCAALLVMDPKRELAESLRQQNENSSPERRFIELGAGGRPLVVDLFEGLEPLDLSGKDIVRRIFSLSETHDQEKLRAREPFWLHQAEVVLSELVEVDLHIYRRGGYDFLKTFWREVSVHISAGIPGASIVIDTPNYPAIHAQLMNLATQSPGFVLGAYLKTAKRFQVPESLTVRLGSLPSYALETYSSVVATLNNLLEVAETKISERIWLNPFEQPSPGHQLSIREALEEGWCVVFVPMNNTVNRYVARALKTKFFELSFCRETERPFVYVADEFQQVITSDPVSGEQSFLERCRAFKTICVLATQSVSGLRYALADVDGQTERSKAALDVLLTNVGTQLYFRTTDAETTRRLSTTIPAPSHMHKPHVVRVRPPSTLAVGECYFVSSSGEWGRGRVKLEKEAFGNPEPAQGPNEDSD